MIGERIELWHKEEYHYPAAHGFIPIMVSYIHEDELMHPAMLVVPGGGYRLVSPSEAHLVAMEFYQAGYNVFVLEYTVNPLDEAPLKLQPLKDISRAMRMIRFRAEQLHILSDQIVVCGFSAGGHLCASLCVHGADIEDPDAKISEVFKQTGCCCAVLSGNYFRKICSQRFFCSSFREEFNKERVRIYVN